MRKILQKIAVGVILLALLGPLPAALAQDESPNQPTVSSQEKRLTLGQLIARGGLTMFPLGLFSIAVVALVIRNHMNLKESVLLPPDALPRLTNFLEAGHIEEAQDYCSINRSLLTDTFSAGLERAATGTATVDVVKEAIEDAGTEQMLSLMRPINYLSIIGAVAPMLGLLGTVSGMIKAFQTISVGGMGKPELLAQNIGEALVTTATGLIIAIPAMLFYFYFKNNFMKTMASMGRQTGTLVEILRGHTMTADET
jgi:biopolymer transport protein ExbB